ncbi:MAG: ABC transporter permease [Dehalococcoidia bacterium]|nr:ABC transporter permease [Dehalococcoidia bacterium]
MQQQAVAREARVPSLGSLWQSSRRWPLIPLFIVLALVLCAVAAPLIAPHDPLRGDLFASSKPPAWLAGGSSEFLLGTDIQGRDVLSRVIYGARISLLVAVVVITTGGMLGVTIGLAAGYYGGQLDELLMRIVDFTLAVPFILIALVVVIVFGQSLELLMILLALFSWGGFSRQVRAETLSLKTRDYVAFARTAGASPVRIMVRHLFPGVVNTVMVVATLRVGQLILTESILSYLGAGIPPPTAAWGLMVAEGRAYVNTEWWIAFFPGVAIFLTVFAMNFLGDWARDRLDPALRQI